MNDKQKKEIRKAYFSGKLNLLLDKYAAEDMEEKTIKQVEKFLEGLKKERQLLHKRVSTFELAKKEIVALPDVNELMKLSDGKKQAIETWEVAREAEYAKAQAIFIQAKNRGVTANTDQYLEWGFELLEHQYNLDLYRIWKDQLYRAKIISFVDSYGCSRAEAEDRAKITPEYMAYKKAILFRGLVEEAVMLCKKKYGAFN